MHQRKRVTEMMMSLLKDLGDIGTIVGGNTAETRVSKYRGEQHNQDQCKEILSEAKLPRPG